MSDEVKKKEEEGIDLDNFVPRVTDSLAGRLSSRKLFVWVVSTVAFFTGHLNADYWVMISAAYVSTQGILDFYKAKLGR